MNCHIYHDKCSFAKLAFKCDELHPSCQYCTDRSIQCTYPSPRSSLRQRRSTTPDSQPTPSRRPLPNAHPSPLSAVSSPVTSIGQPLRPSHQINSAAQWSSCDLELLHFYTTKTSLTFSSVAERQHVWQYVVPQIALSHEFLLHALLALSALHLSQVSPERHDTLIVNASIHHATALQLFRFAVESLSSENCHACSAFGTLVAVYEWAVTDQTSCLFFASTENPSDANSVEWVQLIRGSGNIVASFYVELMDGPLKPVLQWDVAAEHEADSNPTQTAKFATLEQLWNTPGFAVSPAELDALNEALRWLKIIYTMLASSQNDSDPPSAVLSWPVRVPELYLLMVNQRQPVALVLLSHYCLLLNKVESYWWIRGTSRKLLQEITLILGEEWETWIGWPLQDLVLTEFKNPHPG